MIDLSSYTLEDIEDIHYALQLRIDDLTDNVENFNDIIDALQCFDNELTDYIEECIL